MTANVAAIVFNTLATAFFVVLVLAAALGAYAAVTLKKMEKRLQKPPSE